MSEKTNRISRWLTFRPWQRHSLVLMIGGLVYIGMGVAFLGMEPTPLQERTLVIALDMLPTTAWGNLFILAGMMACLSSRWPEFSDGWGYMVLCGLSSGWAATYFLGYYLADAPSSNLRQGLMWLLVAFMWWAISGLLNPPRVVVTNGPD